VKVHQGLPSSVHFVITMENTTNQWSKVFHVSRHKCNFPTESKPDMC